MIYIWVRATTDWEDARTFVAQLDPAFKPKVDTWNATFDVPFHRFRHEVRRIAALNHSRVEGAVVAAWDEIPAGALVVPVDDDDWFAPNLARVLDADVDPHALGCHWISSVIEIPINIRHKLGLIRRALFPRPPRWMCTTNNYAMVKRPESKDLLARHTLASAWFASQGGGRITWIGKHLSVANRTLASQTSLAFRRPSISRSALIRKFRKYQSLYSVPPAAELAWCRPYVAMMATLMAGLRVKSD